VSSISNEQVSRNYCGSIITGVVGEAVGITDMLYSHNIYNTKTDFGSNGIVRNTSGSAALLLLQCMMRRRLQIFANYCF
jgi:hypothetical protein